MKLRKNEPADGAVDESASGSRKGLLVAAGVAAGLAVVAGMGYVLVSGGDDTKDSGVVAGANHAAVGQPAPTATDAATAAPAIKKFNGKNARDPFKALVVEPASSSGGAATGATSGATTGASTGAGTAPTTNPTSPVVNPATTAPTHVSSTITIRMVSVASNNSDANIKVGTKPFNGVKPMEEFGEHFKLLNLRDGKCGAVQYGDATYDVCEGKPLTIG